MKTQKAIQSFLNNRRAQNVSPQTIQWYGWTLKKFAEACPKLPSNLEPIEEFLVSCKISPRTKQGYFKVLRVFYRFMESRYNFPDPMTHMVPPRVPKKVMPSLEPREIMRLIDHTSNLRDRALVTLFADTGARLAEIAGLCRNDIKDDHIIVNGKTGQREIPILEETRRLLLALIGRNGNSEHVFTTHLQGQPLRRSGIYYIIHSLMLKVGVQGPKLGPHRIRHAFGKGYLVSGGDIRSLQQIMGHASITTTQQYASLNLNDITTKHHKFTLLRAAHAAAQESFLDTDQALREAEAILKEK